MSTIFNNVVKTVELEEPKGILALPSMVAGLWRSSDRGHRLVPLAEDEGGLCST